jgi:shikimate kinase
MKRHIVLVGLPGAGKTAVARLVAEQLSAPAVDLDAVIIRQMQMPVARIFGEFGEQRFRQAEREAMARVLAGEPAVVSPGAGWAAQPGELDAARPLSVIVHLRCSAVLAAKRLEQGATRPLFQGENPDERMRQLAQEREPFYTAADFEVRNESRPIAAAAAEIAALARAHGGW